MARIFSISLKRAIDIVARIGGDEFAILLPQTDAKHAVKVAQVVLCEVKISDILAQYKATCSMGIAEYHPTDSEPYDILLKEADSALYTAKSSGKSQYSVHT